MAVSSPIDFYIPLTILGVRIPTDMPEEHDDYPPA
jgi:hypothetical protein